jgi:ABC-type nitrate/sulfonate/bicarbonate transport system substrate-binding protein
MPNRRRILVGAAALLVVKWRTTAAVAQPLTLKAGIADPTTSDLAWWMARDAGFFTEQGVNVDVVPAGGNKGLEMLQAGQLDVMHRGLSNIVRVNRAGGDLRIIGCLGDKVRFVFFSAPGVKTAADLKGGIVAIGQAGSESDIAVTLGLKRLGLSRDDVVIKDFGTTQRQFDAVKSGEAKATMLSEPYASAAREQGVNVLLDLAAEKIPWLFTGIAVGHGAIATKRDAFKRFLKATIEGNYLAFSNEQLAKEKLATELKISDPKVLDISYRDYKNQTPLNADLSPKAAENTLAQFSGISTRLDDYIDASLLDEIRQEGFFAAMRQKYNLH